MPIVTIDFETFPIQARPDYPPKPVGVAIQEAGKAPEYLTWGKDGNTSREAVERRLKALYRTCEVLMHNGKFDLEVGERWFGLPLVPPKGWHDSMIAAFLFDPREPDLKLKNLAQRHLGIKPSDQTRLHDWIIKHVEGAKRKKNLGEYYHLAPQHLLAPYAKADVRYTARLFKKYFDFIKSENMLEQYEIEKRVVIKSIEMEREGVNIDEKELLPALELAKVNREKYEKLIYKKIGVINLNSGKQKFEAFNKKNLMTKWEMTDKDNPKTDTESLMLYCKDKKLVRNLDMFSRYSKIIGTYMEPWLESAQKNNGKFYPWFNTIKGDNAKGTYTGRFSSNFQQVPRRPSEDYQELPFLRNFIIPDSKKQLLYVRDFSSQEIRILAHFEDGELLEAYQQDVKLDPHNFVKDLILRNSGVDLERPAVKGANFLIVYGGGPKALSKNIDVTYDSAQKIFKLHSEALSGVKQLKREMEEMARKGEVFKTAGGRIYQFEDGFEYVGLNTLIQGSAADHSKRALINIDDMLKEKNYDARIVLTVHDEFMISGQKSKTLMRDFKQAMEINKLFDLQMLSEGKIGYRWGQMEKVKE